MPRRQDATQEIPSIQLGQQVANTAPLPVVQHVTREIATVMIEVPICKNPPERTSVAAPYVAVHLTQSRARKGGKVLHALHWALKETGATLGNGRPVRDRNDVLIWLLDQVSAATEA